MYKYQMYTGPEVDGTFEGHITVTTPRNIEPLKSLATSVGCKMILIELPDGENPKQLMLNFYIQGNVHDACRAADAVANILTPFYEVLRIKIEAVTTSKGVPVYDSDIVEHSAENYFEYHIKLKLPTVFDQALLESICDKHDARLSRNAFKVVLGGEERFVTLRVYKVGRISADLFLASLKADLERHFTVAQTLKEYSLYDTNARLDRGWGEKLCLGCESCVFVEENPCQVINNQYTALQSTN